MISKNFSFIHIYIGWFSEVIAKALLYVSAENKAHGDGLYRLVM